MTHKPAPDILSADMSADSDAFAVVFGPTGTVLAGVQAVPLEQIDDNPFQPRETYGGIEELAADIAANGLLQIPRGRRVGGRVQLQYGHRRLRAVRHLGWSAMPVEVETEVADDDMAVRAWAENHNRHDFSPLDRAKYFAKLLAANWTQRQIADRLQLSAPVVSSALRLLELPQELQQQVADSGLSARQAEAIVALQALPAALRDKGEKGWADETKPSAIMRDALTGVSSDVIRKRTNELIRRSSFGAVHDQPWYARELAGADMLAASCKTCPHAIKRDAGVFCAGSRECLQARADTWARAELADAADALGLPALGMMPGHYERTILTDHPGLWAYVQQTTCQHDLAGVAYDADVRWSKGPLAAYPNAKPICAHGQGKKCRCLLALQRGAASSNKAAATTTSSKKVELLISRAAPPLAALLATISEQLLRHLVAPSISWRLAPNRTIELSHTELADQCASEKLMNIITTHKSPGVNEDDVRKLYALLGLPDPFVEARTAPSSARESAPSADDIRATLASVETFVAAHTATRASLPAPASVAEMFDLLDDAQIEIPSLSANAERLALSASHADIYERLAGLSDRVQAQTDGAK